MNLARRATTSGFCRSTANRSRCRSCGHGSKSGAPGSRRTRNGWRSSPTIPAATRCMSRPFEARREKIQISIGGGIAPRWRSDGEELFYVVERRQGRDGRVHRLSPVLNVGSRFRSSRSQGTGSPGPRCSTLPMTSHPDGQRFCSAWPPEKPRQRRSPSCSTGRRSSSSSPIRHPPPVQVDVNPFGDDILKRSTTEPARISSPFDSATADRHALSFQKRAVLAVQILERRSGAPRSWMRACRRDTVGESRSMPSSGSRPRTFSPGRSGSLRPSFTSQQKVVC